MGFRATSVRIAIRSAPARPAAFYAVCTPDGLPLAHEVFAGNRKDVSNVGDIVRTMEEKYGQPKRVSVMDRDMVHDWRGRHPAGGDDFDRRPRGLAGCRHPDLNGDGLPDLIFQDTAGRIAVCEVNPTGAVLQGAMVHAGGLWDRRVR